MNERRAAANGGDPVAASLNRTMPLPKAARIAVAAIVAIAGALFALVAATIPLMWARRPIEHPVAAVVVALGCGAVACLFGFLAVRVLSGRTERLYVLNPWVRRAFGGFFGIAAIGMLVRAWHDDSVAQAAEAYGVAFFAFLIVRSTIRR